LRISSAFEAEVVPDKVLSLCLILFLELANLDLSSSSGVWLSRTVLLETKQTSKPDLVQLSSIWDHLVDEAGTTGILAFGL
jgi:hypothetical protein